MVTERWKYIEWGTGEVELYDLNADPYELQSLHASPPADAPLADFARWTDEHRALGIVVNSTVEGVVGVDLDYPLVAWGGTAPLTWSLALGSLPAGLVLDRTGRVYGAPTTSGSFTVSLLVTDSADSPITGEPATYQESVSFSITEASMVHTPPPRLVARVADVEPVTFSVRSPPGADVWLTASLDETQDSPQVRSLSVVTGANGVASVPFPGLDRGRAWYVQAAINGVTVPGGWVLPSR